MEETNIMVMPKKIVVIKPEGTEIMNLDIVYRTFKIDEHQLANCINYGKGIESAAGDVYFDIPLD